MVIQGMKILAALLASCLSLAAASFPVFIGDPIDYLTNRGDAIILVSSNRIVAIIGRDHRDVLFTNNSSEVVLKLDNGSAATQLGFYRNGGEAIRFSVDTTGKFKLIDSTNSLISFLEYDTATELLRLPLVQGGGTVLAFDGSKNIFATNLPYNVSTPIQVSGVGGANTNFTFQASDAVTYVDAGTSNVNIVAIMGGSTSLVWEKSIIFTNRTATSRTISFSAVTNNFIALQEYDGVTNAGPITVTNSQAVYMWATVRGSNVAYAFKPARNPSF